MGQPVVYFEIVGTDSEKLRRFYSTLFGWKVNAGNATNYGIVRREDNLNADGVGVGGGIGTAPAGSPGHVTFYVEVPDVDAALTAVEYLGGKRLFGPDQAADDFEVGVFTDPRAT